MQVWSLILCRASAGYSECICVVVRPNLVQLLTENVQLLH